MPASLDPALIATATAAATAASMAASARRVSSLASSVTTLSVVERGRKREEEEGMEMRELGETAVKENVEG